MKSTPITLFQLNNSIKKAIENAFNESIWVIAEISEIKVNQNGHCYLELVEKEEEGDVISKAKATIWAYTYRILKPYFETSTGQTLSRGIKVLIKAHVEFHELYGFTLNVQDIEPSFTIGEIERKRLETIKKLEDDGVIQMNKELEVPLVIKNIAIISSETAAGYEDFLNHLHNNDYGYTFNDRLFPAIMQGKEAVDSINNALDKIYDKEEEFDVVVLIRGGGSQLDLNCFDDYWLAYHITQFTLPIVSGIGHTKDNTVVDLVVHTSLKTPTAVADYIVSINRDFEIEIEEIGSEMFNIAKDKIQLWKTEVSSISKKLHKVTSTQLSNFNKKLAIIKEKIKYKTLSKIQQNNNDLYNLKNDLIRDLDKYFSNTKNNLLVIQNETVTCIKTSLSNTNSKFQTIQNKINYLNPDSILKRGYSITVKNGKIVKSIKIISENDELITQVSDGSFKSKVLNKSI